MDDIGFSYADPKAPVFKRGFVRCLELATGQRRVKRLYLRQRSHPVPGETFFAAAIRHLELDLRFDANGLAAVPRTGPLVVVANHPFGVLDGIVIAALMEKVRPDFRVLTNAVLLRAPELEGLLLPVDFSGNEEALATNLATRAAARAHLEAGGCVIVFPAGGVSTAPDRLGRQPAVDAPWQAFVAQLVMRTRATVLPVFFAGQNSRLFQVASHVSLTLRVALIFREVTKRIGTAVTVAIGTPIPFDALPPLRDRQGLMTFLRAQTYALAGAVAGQGAPRPHGVRKLARSVRNAMAAPRERLGRFAVQPRPR